MYTARQVTVMKKNLGRVNGTPPPAPRAETSKQVGRKPEVGDVSRRDQEMMIQERGAR